MKTVNADAECYEKFNLVSLQSSLIAELLQNALKEILNFLLFQILFSLTLSSSISFLTIITKDSSGTN